MQLGPFPDQPSSPWRQASVDYLQSGKVELGLAISISSMKMGRRMVAIAKA
jgi:hypothetical protein